MLQTLNALANKISPHVSSRSPMMSPPNLPGATAAAVIANANGAATLVDANGNKLPINFHGANLNYGEISAAINNNNNNNLVSMNNGNNYHHHHHNNDVDEDNNSVISNENEKHDANFPSFSCLKQINSSSSSSVNGSCDK